MNGVLETIGEETRLKVAHWQAAAVAPLLRMRDFYLEQKENALYAAAISPYHPDAHKHASTHSNAFLQDIVTFLRDIDTEHFNQLCLNDDQIALAAALPVMYLDQGAGEIVSSVQTRKRVLDEIPYLEHTYRFPSIDPAATGMFAALWNVEHNFPIGFTISGEKQQIDRKIPPIHFLLYSDHVKEKIAGARIPRIGEVTLAPLDANVSGFSLDSKQPLNPRDSRRQEFLHRVSNYVFVGEMVDTVIEGNCLVFANNSDTDTAYIK